jgi:hypothetical protein
LPHAVITCPFRVIASFWLFVCRGYHLLRQSEIQGLMRWQ